MKTFARIIQYAIFVLVLLSGYSFADEAAARPPVVEPRNENWPSHGVLVIANSKDPASMQIARHFLRSYNIPLEYILALPFDDHIEMPMEQVKEKLLDPFLEKVEQLRGDVEYVVLVRGVPYRTGTRSVASTLLYGIDSPVKVPHPYFGRRERPDAGTMIHGQRMPFVTLITGYDVQDCLNLINRSQHTYDSPSQAPTVFLSTGVGPRGVRENQIDRTFLLLRRLSAPVEKITDPQPRRRTDTFMLLTGAKNIEASRLALARGSIVDNLTSFGGCLFDEENRQGQTSILDFIRYGAGGTFGTVSEPTNILTRWASYEIAPDYLSGDNLAQVYYRHVADLGQAVIIGNPLMAPLGTPCEIEVEVAPNPSVNFGAELNVLVNSASPAANIRRVEVSLNSRSVPIVLEPRAPRGSTFSLIIKADDIEIMRRNFSTDRELTLSEVLSGFVQEGGAISVVPTGKYRDKLQIRVALGENYSPETNITATMNISQGHIHRSFSCDVRESTNLLPAFVINVGRAQPKAGDSLRLVMQGKTFEMTAGADHDIERFFQELFAKVQREFGAPEPGLTPVCNLRRMPDGNYSVEIMAPSFDYITAGIRATVNRVDGSNFLSNVRNGRLPTATFTARGNVAEGILEPHLNSKRIEQRVQIPNWEIYPGQHTVFVRAVSANGDISTVTRPIRIAKIGRSSVDVSRKTAFLGDDIRFNIVAPSWIREGEEVYGRVIINGVGQEIITPSTRTVSYKIEPPVFSPGLNSLAVQWLRRVEDDWIGIVRDTNTMTVRFPLRSTTTFSPQEVEVGQTVVLRGDYLNTRHRIVMGENRITPRRSVADGRIWEIDTTDLQPGEYELEITGNNAIEELGKLPGKLIIREAQN